MASEGLGGKEKKKERKKCVEWVKITTWSPERATSAALHSSGNSGLQESVFPLSFSTCLHLKTMPGHYQMFTLLFSTTNNLERLPTQKFSYRVRTFIREHSFFKKHLFQLIQCCVFLLMTVHHLSNSGSPMTSGLSIKTDQLSVACLLHR